MRWRLASRLLSQDLPRSRALGALLGLVVVGLAALPFMGPGAVALDAAASVLVLIVLAAGFDLALGYAGLPGLAHTLFFAIGSQGLALAGVQPGAGWGTLGFGLGAAVMASLLLSGLLSLSLWFPMGGSSSAPIGPWRRLRPTLPFALTTLAAAGAVWGLAAGRPMEFADPGAVRFVAIDDPVLRYFALLAVTALLMLGLLRVVNSPFGSVLRAIRDNPDRAESLGYRVGLYRAASHALSALLATLAGACAALWGPNAMPAAPLSPELMLQVLLIVVAGGLGTLYGAVLGSVSLVLARAALHLALPAAAAGPWFVAAQALCLVLAVCYFPRGCVAWLRARRNPPRTDPA